jgi:hypothetical protein
MVSPPVSAVSEAGRNNPADVASHRENNKQKPVAYEPNGSQAQFARFRIVFFDPEPVGKNTRRNLERDAVILHIQLCFGRIPFEFHVIPRELKSAISGNFRWLPPHNISVSKSAGSTISSTSQSSE